MDWIQAHQVIREAKKIALTTHENPDGDGLGCAAAFYHYLKSIGRETRIIIHGKFPGEYQFLNRNNIFESYSEMIHSNWLSQVDLVIIFDIGDIKRLNSIRKDVEAFNLPLMNIDHHPTEDNHTFEWNFVDTDASATGEMLYDYFEAIGLRNLSEEIYEGLYTAILTDTGSFRYSNTNIRSHEIAIEAIRRGIDHTRIYQDIYETKSHRWIRLLGAILSNLNYEVDGKLGWFVIDRNMLDQTGARHEDIDGFTDFVRTINGVEVAIMFVENNNETCRVNFRSKGRFAINGIAREFNGGGHKFAAGAVIKGRVGDIIPRVVKATVETITGDIKTT